MHRTQGYLLSEYVLQTAHLWKISLITRIILEWTIWPSLTLKTNKMVNFTVCVPKAILAPWYGLAIIRCWLKLSESLHWLTWNGKKQYIHLYWIYFASGRAPKVAFGPILINSAWFFLLMEGGHTACNVHDSGTKM